jgi:hypothetical protein
MSDSDDADTEDYEPPEERWLESDEWMDTYELTSKVYAYYYADTSSEDDTEAIIADALAQRPQTTQTTVMADKDRDRDQRMIMVFTVVIALFALVLGLQSAFTCTCNLNF